VALLLVLRPEPIWWALVLLTSGAVIAAELFNTALELVMDRLHPDVHPMIGRAKDCAAGAVLILSLVSLAIATALIVETCKS
jgi:diacylglycerol kinase (ATP)